METRTSWGCPSVGFYLTERDGDLYLDVIERGILDEARGAISAEEAAEMEKRWEGCSYIDCDCNRGQGPAAIQPPPDRTPESPFARADSITRANRARWERYRREEEDCPNQLRQGMVLLYGTSTIPWWRCRACDWTTSSYDAAIQHGRHCPEEE